MNTVWIGVDPGLSGAVAVVIDGALHGLFDMPTRDAGGRERVDAGALAALLLPFADTARLVLEEPIPVGPPKVSYLSQGQNVGVVAGVAGALGIPVIWTHPLSWKRTMCVTTKHATANGFADLKAYSRHTAAVLFPGHASHFSRARDHDRAESVLLAVWGVLHGPQTV